jgi:hypothetical protein
MKRTILLFLFTLSINTVFADSPLTSTNFYQAYLDIPLVDRTANSNGVLTDEVFDYLNSIIDENSPYKPIFKFISLFK